MPGVWMIKWEQETGNEKGEILYRSLWNESISPIREFFCGRRKGHGKHVLPGQTVEFAVTKQRKGKYEGRLLSVVSRSKRSMKSRAVPMPVSAAAVRISRFHMRSS